MLRTLLRIFLMALLAGAVLWVALPPVAGWTLRASAAAFGLHGEQTEVTVSARPPLKLLLLEADSIQIRSRHVTWRTLSAADLDLTLTGVRLGEPPDAIQAQLEDVDLPDGVGSSVHAQTILLSGTAEMPDVTVDLSPDDVREAVGRVLPADLRGLTAAISLAPPDGLRIPVAGQELTGRVAVGPDGSLTFSLNGPGLPIAPITIMHPDPGLPLVLRSARVSGSGLELTGTLDARAWGL